MLNSHKTHTVPINYKIKYYLHIDLSPPHTHTGEFLLILSNSSLIVFLQSGVIAYRDRYNLFSVVCWAVFVSNYIVYLFWADLDLLVNW